MPYSSNHIVFHTFFSTSSSFLQQKKLKLNNHLAMINTIVLWDPIKPKPPESMLIIIRNDMQIFIPPVPDPNFDFLILSLLWFQVRKARVNPVVHPCSCFERTTMMSDTRWKVILCFQHVCISKSSERNESGGLNCIKFRDSYFFFSPFFTSVSLQIFDISQLSSASEKGSMADGCPYVFGYMCNPFSIGYEERSVGRFVWQWRIRAIFMRVRECWNWLDRSEWQKLF